MCVQLPDGKPHTSAKRATDLNSSSSRLPKKKCMCVCVCARHQGRRRRAGAKMDCRDGRRRVSSPPLHVRTVRPLCTRTCITVVGRARALLCNHNNFALCPRARIASASAQLSTSSLCVRSAITALCLQLHHTHACISLSRGLTTSTPFKVSAFTTCKLTIGEIIRVFSAFILDVRFVFENTLTNTFRS